MKKLLTLLIMSIFLFSLCSAEQQTFGTFKKNECINLIQTCSNCTWVNITTIVYPNSEIADTDLIMLKAGTNYNYTFCKANQTGEYIINGIGDLNGIVTIWNYNLLVTTNGNNLATAGVIIFFSALFLILIGILLFMFIVGLAHTFTMDYDVVDLAENWGLYFVMFGAFMLEKYYLGDPNIDSIMPTIISVTGYTHLLIPIISLGISMIIGSLIKKEPNYGRLKKISNGGWRGL